MWIMTIKELEIVQKNIKISACVGSHTEVTINIERSKQEVTKTTDIKGVILTRNDPLSLQRQK